MKKIIYALLILLVVVSGLVFANTKMENETAKISDPKPLFDAERNTELKKWEASPDGIMYQNWVASSAGKKVFASEAKIRKYIRNNSNMEGVITSLSLPPGSKLGFGVMVKINGEDSILSFRPEKLSNNVFNFNNELEQLHSLKVNDKILLRSKNVSHAPKYSYPIISGDYVERDGKIIYKRTPSKGGC